MADIDLSKLSDEELREELSRRQKVFKKFTYKRNRILLKQDFYNEPLDLSKLHFPSNKKRAEAQDIINHAEIIYRIDKDGNVEPYAFNGSLLSPRKVNYDEVIDAAELNS